MMNREKLSGVWEKEYSKDPDKREAEVLEILMDSRLEGQTSKRPSVETLFHDLFPQRYVLHVHPALVNAVLCSVKGKETISELFPESVFLDACEPGYIMASAFRRALVEYKEKNKK